MNHRHPDADTNDVYPQSFKQEADMERERFRENVIAPLELAESALFDAAQALAGYPGHDAQPIHDLASKVEGLRIEIGGDE